MGGKGRDRTVYLHSNGQWVCKRNDGLGPFSYHEKQDNAVEAAKALLKSEGGGELTIMGEDGKIRSKDTIAPGNDPSPPKDTEY